MAEKNLHMCQRQLAENKTNNVASTLVALDIFAAKGRCMVGKLPFLTRARAGSGGYWITRVNGLLTTRDAPPAGLAGVPHHDRRDCRRLGAAVVPDDRQCNVSERLGGNFQPADSSLVTLLNLFRAL